MSVNKSVEHLLAYGINTKPSYVFGRSIAEAKKEHGDELIRLGSNENPFGPSPKSIEAIIKAAPEANRYPDPVGFDVRTKLAEKFGLTLENFALANGSANIMYLLSRIFVCPGDEVVVENPTFSEYKTQAVFHQGVPVVADIPEDTYELDLDAMYKAVTDKTKLVWICNPNNPTSVAVDGDQLEAFIKKLPDHVVTIIDEAYIEFVDDPKVRSMVHLIQNYNVVILRTFSKIYGLGAMRLGYAIARKEIADCINAHVTSFAVSRPTLDAACAALDDQEYFKKVYEGICTGRKYLTEEFQRLGWRVYRSQTNFLYVDAGIPPMELTEKLEEKGIIIRGNFKYPRISVGTMEENQKLVEACKEVVREMGK